MKCLISKCIKLKDLSKHINKMIFRFCGQMQIKYDKKQKTITNLGYLETTTNQHFHSKQIAYHPGVPTEIALHTQVEKLEHRFECKEKSIPSSSNIVGAFNNTLYV